MVILKVKHRLQIDIQSVQKLRRLDDLFIVEERAFIGQHTVQEFAEVVVSVLIAHLWVRQSQLSWGCEEISSHQTCLHELVHVFAFIAEFGKLAQHNTTNEDIT